MQVLVDDGARIDVRVDGEKRARAVVLIHGFPFDRAIWNAQCDALAASARVIRPDLRGAGSSSVSEGPYLMELLAADVAAILDAMAIDSATLVGHSMGGYVALAFARMFTERLRGLALISGRLQMDTPEQATARRDLAARIERERSIEPVVEAYLPRMFSPQTRAGRHGVVEKAYAIARRNDPMGAAAALRGMALRASSEDIAGDLDVPVLCVTGAEDRIFSIEESRADAQRFPRCDFVVCEESGHLAMMEQPDAVTRALRSWLTRD